MYDNDNFAVQLSFKIADIDCKEIKKMKAKSIASIKELFREEKIDEVILQELRLDERKGIQHLLESYDKQQQKRAMLVDKFKQMQQFEKQFLKNETDMLAGVDEAGRGPLAGPVVAAAVVLPHDFQLIGLTDSKQLTEKQREQFYEYIIEQALTYHVSVVTNQVIDQINILEATKKAMKNALENLKPIPHLALIDAVKLSDLPFSTKEIIKGDDKSVSIAAASVLAKVTRDKIMVEIDEEYPMYDFISNKGYGTKKHLDAIKKYGLSPYHRESFRSS